MQYSVISMHLLKAVQLRIAPRKSLTKQAVNFIPLFQTDFPNLHLITSIFMLVKTEISKEAAREKAMDKSLFTNPGKL